jgi:hypothetical protein
MTRKHFQQRLILQILFCGILFTSAAFAQTDPDPNSPTPVLVDVLQTTPELVGTGSRILLRVTNVDLMDGEGANAFRVYAEDANKRLFRFRVLRLEAIDKARKTFALTVELTDELGIWTDPPSGDLLLSVSWRGLASNWVRIGAGATQKVWKSDSRDTTAKPSSANRVGYFWSGDRIRFLEQTTFGPTAALDARVRRIGLRTWLNEQFEMPYPSGGSPYPNFALRPTTLPTDCNGQIDDGVPDPDPFCYPYYYPMYPVQNWFY